MKKRAAGEPAGAARPPLSPSPATQNLRSAKSAGNVYILIDSGHRSFRAITGPRAPGLGRPGPGPRPGPGVAKESFIYFLGRVCVLFFYFCSHRKRKKNKGLVPRTGSYPYAWSVKRTRAGRELEGQPESVRTSRSRSRLTSRSKPRHRAEKTGCKS